MATLYAQADGNYTSGAWSAADLWNTAANGSGTDETPTSADTLVSNAFTITISDNLTVVKVTNTGGGTFKLSNGITLTCTDGTAGVAGDASDTGAITFDLASPNAAILAAKVLGGNGSKEWGINFTGTGQLTINGSVTGGSFAGAAATGADGVLMSGAGTLIVANGTNNALAGGSGTNARGVYCTAESGAIITATGNLIAGSTAGTSAIAVCNNASITVTGNITGGSGGNPTTITLDGTAASLVVTGNVIGGANWYAITTSGAANITITGNLTGGPTSAIYATGAATITITGNLTAAAAAALSATAAAIITINGTLKASATAAALSCTSASAKVILTGPLITSNLTDGTGEASGVNPLMAARWFIKEAAIGSFYYELRGENVVDLERPARQLYYFAPKQLASTDAVGGIVAALGV